MKKRFKIIESLIALIFASLLLASTIFAWISLRPEAELQEFVVNAGEYKLSLILELRKRNDWETGEFQECRTKAEIEAFFQNAVPNDSFDFRLRITNLSSFPILANIRMNNIESINVNEGFDMRNVFYLDDGCVYLNGEANFLDIHSEEEAIIHDQLLNLYRLNNLLKANNLPLLEAVFLDLEETITVEFTLTYDHTTSHMLYQEGILNIDAIVILYD